MSRCEVFPLDKARPRNYTIDKPFAANPARERFFEILDYMPFGKAVRYALNWHYDVGIFGLWFGENYGSMLTYFGLRSIVESLGLSCVMIENPRMGPMGFSLEPHRFAQRHGYFITRQRPLSKLGELNGICDSFLLGSDQLWNPGLSRPYGFSYFLSFVEPQNKRIAYGTSFGKDTHNIDSVYMEHSAYELQKFDAISVRDDFSRAFLHDKYNGIEAQKVLDPAILCDPERYRELAAQAEPITTIDGKPFDTKESDYIFVYILDPNDRTVASLAKIKETTGKQMLYALDYGPKGRARRLEILQGAQEHGINIMDVPSCEQWLKAIEDSACVLTDSFHGTIFAHVFKRDFVSIPNKGRGEKRFSDLLEILGLTNRAVPAYINNEERVCELLGTPIDYKSSDALLAVEQERSMTWLREALFAPKRVKSDMAFERHEAPEIDDSII